MRTQCRARSEADERFDLRCHRRDPQGQKNKYEVDHDTGASGWIVRCSPQPSIRPTTASLRELGQDGDPLDALVMITEPTFPGCLVSAGQSRCSG